MWSRSIALLVGTLFFASTASFTQTSPPPKEQIDAHNRQAAADLRDNRPDLAAKEFQAILAIDPKNVDAHGNLGVMLCLQGKYVEAIPELRAALELNPNLAKVQALLGIAERRSGDIKAAQGDLEQAFPKVQDPKVRLDAGMELVEVYSSTGDLAKAAAVVSTLQEGAPTDPVLLYTAYRVYSDLANESLLSLSVVAPKSARMHQALAHELAKRGDIPQAIENFREALKLDPQLPGVHFELAEMLIASGTAAAKQEAATEYKAALVSNPRDEQAERRLGDLAMQANDTKSASEHYQRALELQPNDAEAEIGMAKVLMSEDQVQKAEALLQRALQADPTSAVAHFRLSTIYRQSGRTAEAKHELDEYKKYNEMKEKLRAVYRELHREEASAEDEGSAHP